MANCIPSVQNSFKAICVLVVVVTVIAMAVIVTGANSGIGFEVAKSLCRQGYDVVISVRDEEKGDSTVSRIKSEFPDAQLTYFTMEMSDPQSIRSFVEEFKDTGKSLHALINNAGVLGSWMDAKRHCVRGDQSIEEMVMVNCMGPFLLTNLLLDLLKQSAAEEKPSLVVNISSRVLDAKVNEWATNLDDIMTEKPESYISGGQVYRWSKVGLNLWSKVLATHLEGTTVKVNCLCPGFIPGTGLFRNSTTSFLW